MIPVIATFVDIVDEAEIRYMVERGLTHCQIAIHFQNIYPNVRGISEMAMTMTNFFSEKIMCNVINTYL